MDPETKMIIPKAEKGKRNRGSNASVNKVLPDDVIREINEQKQQIQELQAQVSELSRKNKNNTAIIKKMRQLLDTCE